MGKIYKRSSPEAAALTQQVQVALEAQRLISEKLKQLKVQVDSLTTAENAAVKDRKATLTFSDRAWTKMVMLVHDADKEIAWHFTASRRDNDEYFVEDVLPAYPQRVTAASVDVDSSRYALWVNEVPDEVWNKVKGQGHSHVNMTTSPSSTDKEHQKEALQNITDFYFFIIFNKRDEHWALIVDVQNNIIFENPDVAIEIEYSDDDIYDFIVKSRGAIEAPVTTYGARSTYGSAAYNGATYGSGTAYGAGYNTGNTYNQNNLPAQATGGSQGNVYDMGGKKVDQKVNASEKRSDYYKWWENPDAYDSDERFYGYYSEQGGGTK